MNSANELWMVALWVSYSGRLPKRGREMGQRNGDSLNKTYKAIKSVLSALPHQARDDLSSESRLFCGWDEERLSAVLLGPNAFQEIRFRSIRISMKIESQILR